MFKFVKIREFYEIVNIRKNLFYRITSKCKVFESAQHWQSITLRQPLNGSSSLMIEDCDSDDTGEDSEDAGDS